MAMRMPPATRTAVTPMPIRKRASSPSSPEPESAPTAGPMVVPRPMRASWMPA